MNVRLGIRRGVAGSLFLALVTVGGLAACGGGGGTESAGDGADQAEGTAAEGAGEDADGALSVLMLSSASYDPCSEVSADAFTEATGREVEMVHEAYTNYHDKAITALAGGATYDVIMFAYQWTGEFAAQGLLLDLTDMVGNDPEVDGIFPSTMDLYTHENGQYAIPFTAQSETLFYRADILEDAGFDVPTTWGEYEEIAKFFTDNPDYPGMTGTSMKAATQHIQQAFDNRYWGLGGDQLGEPGSTMDLELTKQVLEQLKGDVLDYSPAGALVATFSEAQQVFVDGNAVMVELMPSTVLALLKDESSPVYGKVGAAVMPGGHGEIGSWAMAVAGSTDKPNAAYQFAKIASSPELDLQCQVEFGKSAVRASTYEDPELASTFYAASVRAGLESGYGIPNGFAAMKINNMVAEEAAKYLAGQYGSADEAAQSIVDQYAELVNQTE